MNLLDTDTKMRRVIDTMITSVFYFEIDIISQLEGGAYHCSGTFFSRVPQNVEARQMLHSLVRSAPTFCRQLSFVLKALDEKFSVSIIGITSAPALMSGMPSCLKNLCRTQSLYAPFGRIDNWCDGRSLPYAPLQCKLQNYNSSTNWGVFLRGGIPTTTEI